MKIKKTALLTIAAVACLTVAATTAFAASENISQEQPVKTMQQNDKFEYGSLVGPEMNESSKIITNDEQICINADTMNVQSTILFADQGVIDEIATEIANEDINSFIEVDDAALGLNYTLPIYITLNMTQGDDTVLETLVFDNQYMIPVMSDSTCIGALTIVKFENKWTISSFVNGFDIVQFIQSNKNKNVCLVNIPQLKGEYGLLEMSDVGEKYIPAPGFITSDTKNGKQLLKEIREH